MANAVSSGYALVSKLYSQWRTYPTHTPLLGVLLAALWCSVPSAQSVIWWVTLRICNPSPPFSDFIAVACLCRRQSIYQDETAKTCTVVNQSDTDRYQRAGHKANTPDPRYKRAARMILALDVPSTHAHRDTTCILLRIPPPSLPPCIQSGIGRIPSSHSQPTTYRNGS